MKKILLPILISIFATTCGFGDDLNKSDSSSTKKKLRDRIVIGGNIGFQLGNVTYIDVSPLVGYRFTPKFQAGVGVSYIYAAYRQRVQAGVIKEHVSLYGGRVYGQYNITQTIFAHTEGEFMNVPYYNATTFKDERKWIFNPLVGGGLRTSLGGRATLNFTVLYNLNYYRNSEYIFYNSPLVIRGGITL